MVRTNHPDLPHAIDRVLEQYTGVDKAAEDQYFANTRAPEYLPEVEEDVKSFLAIQKERGRRVAVVTSGGTTVPLENNTVRFIDNFSAGTRGSVSAEFFLKRGYAVIFLHREFSLRPFSQHYASKSVLDLLSVDSETGEVKVNAEYSERIKKDLETYNQVKADQLLLEIPFTTVNQYLYTLRMIGTKLQVFGSLALFYLAAAVSDFFLPMSKVSEHKIQSRGMAKLVVDLDPVPKFLKTLANEWTPSAMIVSFKLETDRNILLSKCHGALEKYGHQLVVGNLLQTRKVEIYLVSPDFDKHLTKGPADESIEDVFLPYVLDMHQSYIEKNM